MLQTIRDKTSGWIAIIVLGAIGVVFALFGVDLKSAAGNYAAKVDGETVPTDQVRRAWQQRQQQLQQMMRTELPPDLVKSQQAALLDQLIRDTLLTNRAQKLGYRVSDEDLAEHAR